MDYLTTHTSLSPIRFGFAPGFVNYKKGCTRFTAASDKAYQLLAHGRWFSPSTPDSSTTKTGRHDIAEILLKVALNTTKSSIIISYVVALNFPIVSFPFICSNIPAAPAYGVYISQMIRYSRACGSYQDFIDRGLLLTRKLLNQGFLLVKVKSSLRKFYDRHHDLVDRYGISVTNDHGYVPLVKTSRSFPHSRLITGFVTRLTRWVSLVEQELPTLPEHLSSPRFLVGFMLLDL